MAWVLSPGDVAVWRDAPVDELLDVRTAGVTAARWSATGSACSTCGVRALHQRLVSMHCAGAAFPSIGKVAAPSNHVAVCVPSVNAAALGGQHALLVVSP
jgi:hypothetical protein